MGLNGHYRFHRNQPLVSVLSHINPVCALLANFFKIQFNSVLAFVNRPVRWPLSFRFSHQHPVRIFLLPHACHVPCPSHPSWFDQADNICWGVQIFKLFIMQFSPVPCYSPLSLSTLYSNTIGLCSSFMWETKFHTHTEQCAKLWWLTGTNYRSVLCVATSQLLGLFVWNEHWQVVLEFVSAFLARCEHNLPYIPCTQKQIKQVVEFFTLHSNMNW